MALKKYNNLLTSGICSSKDPKDAQILALVGVAQILANGSRKPLEYPIRYSTKGYPAYIRDLSPWMLEETKGRLGHKFNNDK